MKLWSDEALYFGIVSSKVPDGVFVNAPNLMRWWTKVEELHIAGAYFQRSSENQVVRTVALGTPDYVRYSSMAALSTCSE